MQKKGLYSINDFTFVVFALYFKSIEKTRHYQEFHEREVPWSEVVEVILTSKEKRRKGSKITIINEKYYILLELKKGKLSVINAKRRK